MQLCLEIPGVPNACVHVHADHHFAALIQKLRWMGLDDEAEELFERFGGDGLCEFLVSTAPYTD